MIRILIVDDEAPMRDLIAQAICKRGEGFTVVGVAGDGAQALDMCRELSPDIVVTDIFMPFIDGLSFLQNAQEEGMAFKAVIISGRDEFDCARQAISLGVTDYLLKPFLPSELFAVLDKIKKEIESQRVLKLNMDSLQTLVDQQRALVAEKLYVQIARGALHDTPALGTQERTLFRFDAKFFCAGQLRLNSPWDASRDENFMSLLSEYFSGSIVLHSASLSKTQTALLFTGDGDSEEIFLLNLKSGLSRCQASLRKHFDMQFRCAVGSVRRDWRQLCESYEEALSVWRTQTKADKPLLFFGENAAKTSPESGDATKQIRQIKMNILLEVRMGNRDKALERLDSLMKCYAALSNKKSDYIFISAGELVYAISGELEERYGEVDEGLLSRIEGTRQKIEFSSLLEMKMALEHFVADCCDWVQQRDESGRGKRLIEQVISLIETELANPDLSLEWVSGRINFSPHYIRQVFKQHMGEAFTDYVIRKRMERAGTLLRTSNLLVQDVALSCGYANQRYFASSFKKYYGQTPTEYKQQMIEGQENI